MLVSFLREETAKAGLRRAVVGLSGGVDSAAVAALAAEAFGPGNVLAVHTPYRTSSAASLEDAREVATRLGIELRVVPITPQIEAYYGGALGELPKVRMGNKMARERKSIEFDLAWPDGAVLGTSNKTELLLGYGTWFGDMASSLNPVGDLYKTQLRELAVLVGIPQRIVTKAPSAELWEGQTDEEELGFTYAQADLILYFMVDRRARPDELVRAGFDERLVLRIRDMVRKSHFKRVMPLIAKVSLRTIGHDFLYPRDWESD
jgi:NAD+ synthase